MRTKMVGQDKGRKNPETTPPKMTTAIDAIQRSPIFVTFQLPRWCGYLRRKRRMYSQPNKPNIKPRTAAALPMATVAWESTISGA